MASKGQEQLGKLIGMLISHVVGSGLDATLTPQKDRYETETDESGQTTKKAIPAQGRWQQFLYDLHPKLAEGSTAEWNKLGMSGEAADKMVQGKNQTNQALVSLLGPEGAKLMASGGMNMNALLAMMLLGKMKGLGKATGNNPQDQPPVLIPNAPGGR